MTLSRIALYLAMGLLVYGGWHLYAWYGNQFSLANITYNTEKLASPSPKPSLEELNALHPVLNQTFTYLDSGDQSYVFLSQDGNYVLKFFKFGYMKNHGKKMQKTVTGFQVAYNQDRVSSGLIYLHFPTTDYLPTIQVKDRFHRTFSIPLDGVIFALQHRGETTRVTISRLLEKGDISLAKERFRQLLDMYVTEYRQGIYDRDHNLMHNTGFIGEKPFHLDVGKFRSKPSFMEGVNFKADLEKIVFKRIDRWMQRYYPKYREEIKQDLQNKLQEILMVRTAVDEKLIPISMHFFG